MSRLAERPELRPAREHAPGALAALESAYEAARLAVDPALADCLRRRVAESLGRPHRPDRRRPWRSGRAASSSQTSSSPTSRA